MANIKKLTLLHSNDFHGDFFAEVEEGTGKLIGGLAYLSGYVMRERAKEVPCIYVISGDMLRGSVIDHEYKGFSTFDVMNALGPDVATLGNHELDYGLAQLLFLEKVATFPIVNANLYIKNTNKRLFSPYLIVEQEGMRILFIGIITEDILDYAKRDAMIETFVSVEDAAFEVLKICDAYKSTDIDLTVLLTHIGYDKDLQLASLISGSGVDIIIGGHSHTVLEKPGEVNGILVVQAGSGSDYIGRFDLEIDIDTNSVVSYDWDLVKISPETCPSDRSVRVLIENYSKSTDAKLNEVMCRMKKSLDNHSRYRETEAGNFIADMLQTSLAVDMMVLGSGSMRRTQLGDLVTKKSLMEFFPFSDKVHEVKISGSDLRKAAEYMVDSAFQKEGKEFYQWSSGVEIVYNYDEARLETFKFNGKDVEGNDGFCIGVQDFHFLNSSKIFGIDFTQLENRVICGNDFNIIEETVASAAKRGAAVEGRIVIKGINARL